MWNKKCFFKQIQREHDLLHLEQLKGSLQSDFSRLLYVQYLGCAMCIYPRTFGTLAHWLETKKHLERSGTTVRFDFLVNARVFLQILLSCEGPTTFRTTVGFLGMITDTLCELYHVALGYLSSKVTLNIQSIQKKDSAPE